MKLGERKNVKFVNEPNSNEHGNRRSSDALIRRHLKLEGRQLRRHNPLSFALTALKFERQPLLSSSSIFNARVE